MNSYMYVCMYVCMYLCMYVCVYVNVGCVHMKQQWEKQVYSFSTKLESTIELKGMYMNALNHTATP